MLKSVKPAPITIESIATLVGEIDELNAQIAVSPTRSLPRNEKFLRRRVFAGMFRATMQQLVDPQTDHPYMGKALFSWDMERPKAKPETRLLLPGQYVVGKCIRPGLEVGPNLDGEWGMTRVSLILCDLEDAADGTPADHNSHIVLHEPAEGKRPIIFQRTLLVEPIDINVSAVNLAG